MVLLPGLSAGTSVSTSCALQVLSPPERYRAFLYCPTQSLGRVSGALDAEKHPMLLLALSAPPGSHATGDDLVRDVRAVLGATTVQVSQLRGFLPNLMYLLYLLYLLYLGGAAHVIASPR
eukprot:3940528-Rhodomonas_salina.2